MPLNAPPCPAILFGYEQLLRLLKRRSAAHQTFRQAGPELPDGPQAIETLERAARQQRFGPRARCPMAGARPKPGRRRARSKRVKNSNSKLAARMRREFGVVHR